MLRQSSLSFLFNEGRLEPQQLTDWHPLSNGFFRGPIISHVAALNSNWLTRQFAQAARKEEEEEEKEEIEYDQRRLPADYDSATFDPTQHRSPPTKRVWRLVDEISGLTLVEVGELGLIMMKEISMKEPPIVGVMKSGAGLAGMGAMKGPAAATKEEKKAEKTVFELKLESYEAPSKIKIIKEVSTYTDLDLMEAKELVEKIPAVFKKGMSKEGEQIIEKMKALGAKVIME